MIDRLVRYFSTLSFQRGLALGALVGAAIAGSTLWTRVREARQGTLAAGNATSGDTAEG
jgi:hypothetical protein